MSVLETQLRGVARRPAKLLLTGLGILVAAFFAYAIVLAQQVVERTVADGLSDTPAGSSVVLRTDGEPMSPAMLAAVRATSGVADASGRLQGGVLLGSEDRGRYFAVLADPGSGPLARTKLASGAYPDAAGEVAITARTAERDGLRVGQRITVRTEDGTTSSLTVTGVVGAPEDGGTTFYTLDRWAAGLLGSGFERIDVQAAPGTSVESLLARMPAEGAARAAAAVRTEEIADKVEEMQPIFTLLSMFVAIAVIAAALVVTSTFRIMFAQRMSQLALLRAVGAGRGGLTWALVVEGALTGLVAGLTGVLLAAGAGQVVPRLLDRPVPGLPLGWAAAIVAGSVVVTVLAVLAPAVSAGRVSPLQALRTSATTTGRTGIGVARTVLGVLLVLAAVGAGVLADSAGDDTMLRLAVIVASGTAAYAALLAFGPVLVGPLLKVIGGVLGRLGTVGRLAVGGVGGAPRRAAAVSAVVALGVTLIAGVLVGSATMRSLAETELALEYPADIEARSTDAATPLPADLPARLDARPELAEVLPYRRVEATVGEQHLALVDFDLRALPTAERFQTTGGSLADIGPGHLALPEVLATAMGVKAGDPLTLTVDSRRHTARVGAVIRKAGPLSAATIVDPADLTALAPSAPLTGVLINADGGLTEARAAVLSEIGGTPGVSVDMLADMREEVTTWLAAMTGIALGLLGLTVLIAIVGVGTTTALSVVQRTRESGMLRAIGLSRSGLKSSITLEAGLYGAVGSILGLALGVPYAALLLSSLDIGAPIVVPAGQLAAVFGVLAVLTALAGLLPARRAARVSPVEALGHE